MNRGRIVRREVDEEFDSQTQRLLELGIEPDHLNIHQSILKFLFSPASFEVRPEETKSPESVPTDHDPEPKSNRKFLGLSGGECPGETSP